MSVTPIQLISTIVCFLGTPLSPPHADVIWVSPLSCPWFMHAEKGCNKPTTQGQCRVSVSQLCERTILKVKRRLWQGQDDATLKANRGSNKDLSCVWSTGPCLVWLSRPMPDSAWGNVRPPFIPSYKGGRTYRVTHQVGETSCWHWSESCISVCGSNTKTQLSSQCQQEVFANLIYLLYPVLLFSLPLAQYLSFVASHIVHPSADITNFAFRHNLKLCRLFHNLTQLHLKQSLKRWLATEVVKRSALAYL